MDERFYDEYGRIQDTHWWFVGRRRVIRAILETSLVEGGRGRRILDVGCGTGANLSLLRDFGEVAGVDSEPAAVEFCRRRGEPAVQHAAGSELPFPDASFDLVTLLDVIEHVPDDRLLLREAGRVLAPGGLVLVTVPAYAWMWGAQDRIAHHYRRYTRRRLLAALAEAGLEPRRSSYFNTLLFPPIAVVRLFRRLWSNQTLRSDFELNRPGPFNAILARVFSLEGSVLRRASMPFGVSLLGLAVRPKPSGVRTGAMRQRARSPDTAIEAPPA